MLASPRTSATSPFASASTATTRRRSPAWSSTGADLAPFLVDPDGEGTEDDPDGEDPTPEQLAVGAGRWLRFVARANMAGRRLGRFKLRAMNPKGDDFADLSEGEQAYHIGQLLFRQALGLEGIQAFIGVNLDDVLGPLMRAARFQRPMPNGGVVDVFPLAIRDGEGLSIPVKLFGSIGFRNWEGVLVLILPAGVAELVAAQLATEVAAGLAYGPRFGKDASGGMVAEFAIRLQPGMRKALPFGQFGEVGVEAG